MKIRTQLPLALLTLVACAITTTNLPGESLVDQPEVRKGDLDGLAARWWKSMLAAPNSLETQYYLTLWNQTFALKSTPGPALEDWQQLERATAGNGWSQRLVRWQIHGALQSMGRHEEAAALGLHNSTPHRWLGIGPFGVDNETAMGRSYPPEQAFDLEASYDSQGYPVRWRSIELPANRLRMDPRAEWRRSAGAFYLRTRFSTSAAFEGFLQVASGGSLTVWVDGTRVGTLDRNGLHTSQSVRWGLQCEAGAHTMLVKSDGNPVSFLFRQTSGHAVELTSLDPASHEPRDAGVVALPDLEPVGHARTEWEGLWKSDQLPTNRWLPLALLLRTDADPYGCREILKRWQQQGHGVIALALVATQVIDDLDYLPTDWLENWLADLWDSALDRDDQLVPLLLGRAANLFSEDRAEESLELIDRILELQPRSLQALLLREEISGEREWRTERLQSLARLTELAPDHPATLRRWIQRWEDDDRRDRSLPYRERLLEVRPTIGIARSLAGAYRRAGFIEKAEQALDTMTALAGNDTDSLATRAQWLQDAGRYEEALPLLEELSDRIPDDERYLNAAGNLHWRLGQLEQAKRCYEGSLARYPGQISLVRRIEQLRAEIQGVSEIQGSSSSSPEFWEPYAISSADAIAQAPSPDRYPDAASVYLIDQMVTRVVEGRGVEELIHQLVRLDSAQAVQDFSELSVPGDVLEVRVITADGQELHPTSGDGSGRFTLPGLTPGAMVEYRCVVRRNLRREEDLNIGPFYFRDPGFAAAFHVTEWVVLLPEDWDPYIRERHLPFQRQERIVDGMRELIWRADEMDRIAPEEFSPPAEDILPNVWIHTPRDWSDYLEELSPSFPGSDTPSPELEAAVAQILQGVEGREAQVRALYDAACDRIASDLGGATASEVWVSRAGDRDLLLAGLLRTAGIEYQELLLAPNDSLFPYWDWSIPNTDRFDLSLLRVTTEDGRPLDFTARYRFGRFGDYPRSHQGGRALVLQPWGAEWITLPIAPLEQDAQEMRTHLVLGSDDVVRVRGSLEQGQVEATELKDRLKDYPVSQRRIAVESFVSRLFPGAEVTSGDFPRLEHRGSPFAMEYEAQTRRLLQDTGDEQLLPAVFYPSLMRQRFVRESERRFPMIQDTFMLTDEHTSIELGSDYEVVRLPDNLNLGGPWGTYQVRFAIEGNQVHMRRRIQIEPCLLQPHQIPTLHEACVRIDRKEEERVVLRRSK